MARALDHLVLGVRDLDAAGAFYERLGFTVGARNRHPWGTHNRIVQFPGVFLEIITVGEPALIPEHAPGRFSFGAFVRDALERAEGFSMLALESADSVATQRDWADAGISPYETFFFERQGKRPDGTDVRVAFTLAFARNDLASGAGFFVCQQHEPQNFWNPAFQTHANGASTIEAVTFICDAPDRQAPFLQQFCGVAAETADDGLLFRLPRGTIRVVPEAGQTRWSGFTVRVKDLAALGARLESAGIEAQQLASGVMVPASCAFGVEIRFVSA